MSKTDNSKIFYALSIAWQLGFFITIPIGVFMFLGFWGDKILMTRPILLIFGIFIGFSVSFYKVYDLFIPLIKDIKKKND